MIRFFLLFLLFSGNVSIYKSQYASTLLWRISGNGLKHSSYLYGNMHVTKPDMFQFGDSVVAAIKASKFMATEIAPQQAVLLTQRRMEQYWNDNEEIEKYDTVDIDKINLNIGFDSALFDNLIQLRKKYKERIKANPMPVIMDMHLYYYGKSLGLKLGGVEYAVDIDSLEILEARKVVNESFDLLYRNEVHAQNLENIYITQNLDSLHKLVLKYQDVFNATTSLAPRNLNMIIAMDSLHKKLPSFFGVGAAHLVGNNGLIDLLRKKGYDVTPVFSTQKMSLPFDVNQYIKKQTYYSEDSTLSYVSTAPFLLKKSNNGLINIYYKYDLGERKYFFIKEIFGIPYPEKDADFSNVAKDIITQYLAVDNVDELSAIKVRNGWRQIKFDATDVDKFYTGVIISANSTIYLTYTSDDETTDLYTNSVDEFIKSISIKPSTKPLKWQLYNDKATNLQPYFPSSPIGNYNKVDSTSFVLYTYSKNPKNGDYYLFQHNKATIGYEYSNNNNSLQEIKNFFLESYISYTIDSTQIKLQNGDTRNIYFVTNNDDDLIASVFVDVNFNYQNFGFVCGSKLKKSEIMQFAEKSNYTIIPKLNQTITALDNSFTIAGNLIEKENNTYEYSKLTSYHIYDASTGNTVYITKEPLNKYLHFENDSLAWQYIEKDQFYYNQETDSVYYNLASNQPYIYSKSIDTVLKNVTTETRVYLNGDTMYQISIKAINPLHQSGYIDKWLNSFQFKNKYNSNFTKSKVPVFLNDINSNDTAILEDVLTNMRQLTYNKNDLPTLYHALINTNNDTSKSALLRNDILDKLAYQLENEDTVSLLIPIIKDKYASSDLRSRYRMLYLLNTADQQAAFELLIQLVNQYGFIKSDASSLNIFFSKSDTTINWSKYEKEFGNWLKQPDKQSFALAYFAENLEQTSVKKLLIKETKTLVDIINKINLHIGDTTNYIFEYHIYDVIKIATTLKTKPILTALNRFKQIDDIYLKEYLIEKLIKNDILVEQNLIDDLAANYIVREHIYNILLDNKKADLFPSAYFTQQHFAQSQLHYYSAEDDLYFDTLYFIKPWKINIGKKSYNAFIYKINIGTKDEPEFILAVVGGYDANDTKNVNGLLNYGTYVFIDYDNEYDIDELKTLMQQYAKDLKTALEEDKDENINENKNE